MTERSKWAEAGAIISVITFLFGAIAGAALGGWATATYATTLSTSVSALSATVAELKRSLEPLTAVIPTVSLRLSANERAIADIRTDNATQGVSINTAQQALAVLGATVDTIRHDVDRLQGAAQGRLPGQRR